MYIYNGKQPVSISRALLSALHQHQFDQIHDECNSTQLLHLLHFKSHWNGIRNISQPGISLKRDTFGRVGRVVEQSVRGRKTSESCPCAVKDLNLFRISHLYL